jgi:hypothetical protein
VTVPQKFKTCALASLLFLVSGCIAYVRPVGAWNEPVDLKLDQSSLAGVRIKVDCALKDEDDQLTPQDDEDCMKLRTTLGNMGARILLDELPADAKDPKKSAKFPKTIGDAKTETPDFRVSFLSYPTSSDHCGKSVIVLLLTFGVGPCFEDIDAKAELVITDVAKGTQVKKPVETQVRRILGAYALYMLLVDMGRPVNRKEWRRMAGDHFLTYVQNSVYSFAVRDKLAMEAP